MIKTPKLRFKEFSGDWEEKKLGTMGEFFKGSTLSKAHLSEEGSPCVLYGELYTKYGEVIKSVISKTDLEDSKLVMSQKNDVLIPSSGETAIDIATASCLQQENVILGGDLNVFRSDKLNGVFTSYQLNNSKRHEIAKLAQGASVVHVYNNQLSKLKLNVPSKEEQEKIASFFSLIDDKISLQGEKVEALKDYKKGMMQKIFSRELRFKDDDGRDYPEWEERKLGDIGNFLSGGSLSKNDLSKSGVKCILYGDLFTEYTEVINDIRNYTNKKEKLVYGEYNTLLFPTSTTVDAISLICPSALMIKEKVILGGDMSVFKPMIDNVICSFLSYQINGYLKHEFSKKAQGSTIIHIYGSDLQTCRVLLPCIEEQLKITQLLYSLDKKIEKEQEKLNYLNEYKKGLLQQMFV